MMLRKMMGACGLLPLAFALALTLPGCGSGMGGGSQELNPDGSVKIVPNPKASPDAVPLDQEYGPNDPRSKAKAK